MPNCELCSADVLEGEGFRMDLFIGPARAAKLEARYGVPFPLDVKRVMVVCEAHRPDLVPYLITLGFMG